MSTFKEFITESGDDVVKIPTELVAELSKVSDEVFGDEAINVVTEKRIMSFFKFAKKAVPNWMGKVETKLKKVDGMEQQSAARVWIYKGQKFKLMKQTSGPTAITLSK